MRCACATQITLFCGFSQICYTTAFSLKTYPISSPEPNHHFHKRDHRHHELDPIEEREQWNREESSGEACGTFDEVAQEDDDCEDQNKFGCEHGQPAGGVLWLMCFLIFGDWHIPGAGSC